jgi:hypothetical protein
LKISSACVEREKGMGGEVRANKLWTRLLGAQPQAALPHRASHASHAQGRLSYWRNCCNQSYCARVFRRQSYSSGSCTRRISISCEFDDEGVKADCKKAEKTLVVNRNEASAKIKLTLMKTTGFLIPGPVSHHLNRDVMKMEEDQIWQWLWDE